MFPFHFLAQHESTSSTAEFIDKLARTPLSQIVILVTVCTFLRIAIAPYLLKIPPKHKISGTYKGTRFANEFLDAVIYAGVFVFLIIRPFGVQAFRIPSASMLETLQLNDFIVANKLIYRYSEPSAGEIVVFRPPVYACEPSQIDTDGQPKVDFIKRCVGVPGDKVEIRGGQLYRNDKAVDEPYQKEPSQVDFKLVKYQDVNGKPEYWPVTISANGVNVMMNGTRERYLAKDREFEDMLRSLPAAPIPKGYLLCFGDNRNNSSDGRMWGLVKREDLIGRSEAIWFPLSRLRRTQ